MKSTKIEGGGWPLHKKRQPHGVLSIACLPDAATVVYQCVKGILNPTISVVAKVEMSRKKAASIFIYPKELVLSLPLSNVSRAGGKGGCHGILSSFLPNLYLSMKKKDHKK
jgi:hypothetical protein